MQPLAPSDLEDALPPKKRAAYSGVLHFSCAALLLSLVLLIIAMPFLESLPNGELIQSVLLTLVLILGMLAIGARRKTLAVAGTLLLPALVGRWLNHYRPDLVPEAVFHAAGMLFVVFVVRHLLRFVMRAPVVTGEVLCAGVAGYLLLGILWTLAYLLVAHGIPDSFAFTSGPSAAGMDEFNALYFSFITLSTTGYGDIVPLSRAARTLAIVEAMTGTFYVAILISRLVSLYSTITANPPDETDGDA